jgi:hypothetical protein
LTKDKIESSEELMNLIGVTPGSFAAEMFRRLIDKLLDAEPWDIESFIKDQGCDSEEDLREECSASCIRVLDLLKDGWVAREVRGCNDGDSEDLYFYENTPILDRDTIKTFERY